MIALSPEDRAHLWHKTVSSEPDSREGWLRILANEIQGVIADPLDVYEGLDEELGETLALLDRSGLIGRDDLRQAFEVTELGGEGEREISAAEFVLTLAGALEEASSFETLTGADRLAAHRLALAWHDLLRAEDAEVPEHLSVAEVAAHFDVTPQAVYKWCSGGKIAHEKTPGGSYRIPSAQFDWARGQESRGARRAIAARLLEKHGGTRAPSEEEIAEIVRRGRH